ncbi:MAG: hypothetical protein ACJ77N_17175 [Chloroflexota bacterium]
MRRALAAIEVASVLVGWLVLAAATVAASPTTPPDAGDPRSAGQGPGLVGNPLFALAVVVGIGVLSVVATLLYVRLTAERGG